MNPAPRTSALIPAAGQGTRLGLGPKCLLRLGERSLLEILIGTLAPLVDEILVTAGKGYESEIEKLVEGRATVISGGSTRQESIDHLLAVCTGEIVLIQDAARPFATPDLCGKVLDAAGEYHAAGAFLDPVVPVGHLVDGMVASCHTRQEARIFQAPQAFRRDVLINARKEMDDREFQSTAQMVMKAGYALRSIPGEPENIKITTPLDWLIAQKVIAPKLGLDT